MPGTGHRSFQILVKVRPNAQDAIELDVISNYTYLG